MVGFEPVKVYFFRHSACVFFVFSVKIMPMSDITLLKKEIQFRGSRRGMKELDLLFARYMDAHLDSLSEQSLTQLRDLLFETDQDLFGWLNGERDVPVQFKTPVYETLESMMASRHVG